MSIKEKVRKIVAKQLRVDIEKVTPEAKFIKDLGANELDLIEMIIEFDTEFGLDIPEEDAEEMIKIKDAIKYIEDRVLGRVS